MEGWRALIFVAAVLAVVGGAFARQKLALGEIIARAEAVAAPRVEPPPAAPAKAATPPEAPAAVSPKLPPRPADPRDFAAWATKLAALHHPAARKALQDALAEPRPVPERMTLIRPVTAAPTPDDIELLRSVARDANPNVAAEAVRGLLRLERRDEGLSAALEIARRGGPALAAFQFPRSATGRGGRYHPAALDYSLAAVELADPRVRIEAAGALLRLGDPAKGLAVLDLELARPRSPLRIQAVAALAEGIDLPEVRVRLAGLADDADAIVREKARSLLETWKAPPPTAPLQPR